MDTPPLSSRPRTMPTLRTLLKFIAVIVAGAVGGVAQSQNGSVPRCYYPNGQTATNDYACYLNTTQSFCCTEGVKCLENKICDFINPIEYRFNRGTCTDKTWTSPACPSFCQAFRTDYGSGVVKCPGTTKVCCDNGNNDSNATCCFDTSRLFDMPSGWEAFREIDSSAETAVVNLQTSQTASATTSAVEDATASSSPGGSDASVGTATIVGAAVGGVAGVGVLVLLALLYLKRRKGQGRGTRSGFTGSRLGLWMRKKQRGSAELEGRTTLIHELADRESRHELGAKETPAELSGAREGTVHEMEGSLPFNGGSKTPGVGTNL